MAKLQSDSQIRIAGLVKESVVDGPGLRYVIFAQGCPHHCIGCHNPHTHDFAGGTLVNISEIAEAIFAAKLISGITFSGGEPFVQAAVCARLTKLIKKNLPDFNILAYSGYYYSELLEMAEKNHAIKDFLGCLDVLIDGPYDINKKNPKLPFRGSDNQNIIYLTNRSLKK